MRTHISRVHGELIYLVYAKRITVSLVSCIESSDLPLHPLETKFIVPPSFPLWSIVVPFGLLTVKYIYKPWNALKPLQPAL